jgi:transposase
MRALRIETELSPRELALLARRQADPRVTQRIMGIRLILMGKNAPQAAQEIGLSQRPLREWVHRFNRGGIDALRDLPRPGRKKILPEDQEEAFRRRVLAGGLERDGVRILRGPDIRRILQREFDAEYSIDGAYFLMHRLGLASLCPRPVHPKASAEAMDHFKKRRSRSGSGARRSYTKASG